MMEIVAEGHTTGRGHSLGSHCCYDQQQQTGHH